MSSNTIYLYYNYVDVGINENCSLGRFKFPAIFVIYEMFPLGLFEVSILIAFMDRTALYCSSKNLIESLKSPTVFCNIQGMVFLSNGVFYINDDKHIFLYKVFTVQMLYESSKPNQIPPILII